MELNPFIKTSINITDKDLYTRFSRILFVCLKNNILHDDEILNPTINNISELMKNYTILETKNLRLAKNILDKLMIINSSILKKYFDYSFKEEELVIIMYLINENTLQIYLKQHNGLSNLEEYITTIHVDNYLNRQITSESERINRSNLIKVIEEANFWSLNICKLNITQKFIARNFNYYSKNDNKNIKQIIDEIDNKKFKDDNYLSEIEKSNVFDINESLKIKYTLYYITEHPITKKMSMENFNSIIQYLVENKYKEEFYYLIINLLSSKELCHYIINNKYVLEIINKPNVFFNMSFLEKYMPIIKYILGYTWITLYTEEIIKNTYTTIKDRYIFNIETASLLPYFPYLLTDPKTSPYLPILVSNNVLTTKNCYPVASIFHNEYNYGVCNLDIFCKRLSIFFSNSEHNLLEGLDFNGIGITGSCIACCLPNFNPLHLMFSDFNNFANEYYKNSDLDIISNLSDFEFIDKAYHIIDILKINISNKLDVKNVEIEQKFTKSVCICINEDYIKDNFNCLKNEIDYNKVEIKEHFYNKYIEEKKILNNDNILKYSFDKYKNIYDNVSIDDMRILYKPKIYYQCNENIKYKISTQYSKVIEFFQVKADDLYKTLSTFHLPIVRSYYNGSTVYMTPSCISACMTLYNLDIKYFSSNSYPAEIINKYRQRGFGVFLNKTEKLKLMEYSFQIPFWKDKFNLQNRDKMKDILDYYSYKNDFYKNNKDTDIYDYTIYNLLPNTNLNHWSNHLYDKYKSVKLNDIDLVNTKNINLVGSVIPLNTNYIIIAYTLL